MAKKIKKKKLKNKVITVLLYSFADYSHACPMIRLISPLTTSCMKGRLRVVFGTEFTDRGIYVNLDAIKEADIVVIQRDANLFTSAILAEARRLGKVVVYEVDDLLIKLPNSHPQKTGYDESAQHIINLMRRVDAITVTTPKLKEQLLKYNKNIYVLPNYIDVNIWSGSKVGTTQGRDGKIVMGYMGTPTHGEDLQMISPAIKRILQKYKGRVIFRAVGCITEELRDMEEVELVQSLVKDYREFASMFQSNHIDIALAPLVSSPFNECKSSIKFLEYSICKIPGIYSKIAPYAESVTDGVTGILANDDEESWYKAMEMLIENKDLRLKIGQSAYSEVKEKYTVQKNAHKWLNLYTDLVKQKEYFRNAPVINQMAIRTRPPVITSKVSVIIPVKNGGGQLRELLGRIRSQRRVQDVEIIVIDSESTDNSVQIAEEFGAKVIRIAQKEFNHGSTRNLGAREASGDYLVFTVQDAMPVGDYWLYNMICPFIEYPELAALSSRQFVKPEADLFSLWLNESMARLLGFENDSIYTLSENSKRIDWKLFDSTTKRRLTFLDNVSSCIRRDVFKEIQFSPLINAEDIDFGVKLLERKKTIGYLTSTGVYHWHDRGADDVFKRHYISTKAQIYILEDDLPYFFNINDITLDSVIASIAGTYDLINIAVAGLGHIDLEPVTAIKTFINALKANMETSPGRIEKTLEERGIQGDDSLNSLLGQIAGDIVLLPEQRYNFKRNFIIPDFMDRFGNFAEYLYCKHHTLKGREKDFISCIYKIFAMTAGSALGTYYLEEETLNRLSPRLREIDRLLGEGVCYFLEDRQMQGAAQSPNLRCLTG
jgi:glycosyltransferase involved in cell wall biosynthesis